MFSVSVDFARRGQTRFRFSRALPAVGKRHFVFVSPCPPRASPFSFQNTLARAGQAIYLFISPLPASGKQVISGKEARSTLDKQLYSIRVTTP